jgi:hypothetical protein
MGMPPTDGPERYEAISIHGINVWKSNSVHAAHAGEPITLDLWSLFFFGRHLVVKNAR